MLPDSLATDIDAALASACEFGLAFFPDSDEPHWFGNGTASNDMTMDISPWLGKFAHRITIGHSRRQHMADICLRNRCSTTHSDYIAEVTRVIESCRRRSGKTVYSRVITTNRPGRSYGEIAAELFRCHPSTLRFIYYTPETKAWLGATPELLFDYRNTDEMLHTMAFAGTRRKENGNKMWDDKNLHENKFVVDYITETLKRYATDIKVSELESVAYGNIEHLCANISARTAQHNISELIDALNPTPALCGWPLKDAISDIEKFEHHTRGCYGGFIGFSTEHGYKAYVNLRSMQFDADGCCIYGGGGITAQSNPQSEWEETEAKTELLQRLTADFNNNGN